MCARKNKTTETRYDRLRQIIESAVGAEILEVLDPAIEQLADCEARMAELQTHAFIIYNPRNRDISKQTETFKQWQRLSQVYQNNLKIVMKAISNNVTEDDDALDEFMDEWKTRT